MSKTSRNTVSDFPEITPACDSDCCCKSLSNEMTNQISTNPPKRTNSPQHYDPYASPVTPSTSNGYNNIADTPHNKQQTAQTTRDMFTTLNFADHPAPSIFSGTLPRPPHHDRVDPPTSPNTQYLDKGPCEGTSFKGDHRKPPGIPPSRPTTHPFATGEGGDAFQSGLAKVNMHESFDRALAALEQRTPKVKAEPLMPLADFLKRMGRPTPHAFANPPAAPTPPAGVCPGPACTFGDPEAQVTEVEMVDAQHPDTSEVQKRRRRRDADAKTREVRERLHVTVRVHRESDDTEVPPAPHQVCSPARPQASPAAPAATHTVQDAKPAVEHMSRGPTPSPGSEIQATPPRGLLGIRVVPSAAEREGPSAAVLAAPEEKGQTEPATAVQAMVVLTDVSAFEEMLPEIVRARMGTCAAQSGTIDSGRPIDVGDGPDWAEGQGCLMIEGQGKAAAQDMPIARGWVDSPVGTTAQEGRGGAAGRDSIPLVEPRSCIRPGPVLCWRKPDTGRDHAGFRSHLRGTSSSG